jgi:hypothetical protein
LLNSSAVTSRRIEPRARRFVSCIVRFSRFGALGRSTRCENAM